MSAWDRRSRVRRRALVPVLLVGLLAILVACEDDAAPPAAQSIGDAERGRALFVDYGCATCHQVSGIRQANGRVGPNLDSISEQRIIAGVLPNTPEFMAAWLQRPQEYAPNTGMPDVGVTQEDAGHLTAFLLER